ncbi:hypothetical protein ABK040_013486 [Willaertia magna]
MHVVIKIYEFNYNTRSYNHTQQFLEAVHLQSVIHKDSRRENKLLEAVEEIKQLGGKAHHIVCDITKEEKLIINAAGVGFYDLSQLGPIGSLSFDYWRYDMAANFGGVFLGCKYAIKEAMEKQSEGGLIINIASTAGFAYNSNIGPYCISKHGNIDITKMFAKEYAIKKIRVNAVAPGCYESEMTGKLRELNKEAREGLGQSTPMKREATLQEVFSSISYLCSEDATYVTGAVITIDGKMSTHCI